MNKLYGRRPDAPVDGRRAANGPQVQITELRDNHHAIKRMALQGATNIEIADVMGINKEMVSTIRNSDVFKKAMDEMHADADGDAMTAHSRIQALQGPSLDILAKVIREDPDVPVPLALAVKTAQDMLSRGGNSPISKIRGEFVSAHGKFTAEDLMKLRQEAERDTEARINRAKSLGITAPAEVV